MFLRVSIWLWRTWLISKQCSFFLENFPCHDFYRKNSGFPYLKDEHFAFISALSLFKNFSLFRSYREKSEIAVLGIFATKCFSEENTCKLIPWVLSVPLERKLHSCRPGLSTVFVYVLVKGSLRDAICPNNDKSLLIHCLCDLWPYF